MANSTGPFLIALSGPTSSGKTTIATALLAILPPSISLTLIHADDFYKPDSQIPVNKDGVQDWDCAGALDIVKFRETLLKVKEGGEVPEDLIRQGNFEDGIHSSKSISPPAISQAKKEVEIWPLPLKSRPIVLVDGFLLFGKSLQNTLAPLFDLGILLRATFSAAKARREKRNGYVTLEGFWEDPPRYFEDVVWPNYVEEHAWLFGRGDVEEEIDIKEAEGTNGEGNSVGAKGRGVVIGPVGENVGPDETLGWVLGVVKQALGARRTGSK